MAVDNVLESLVEKGMSAEELQERKQRKQHWDQNAAVVNAKMKSLFRQGALHRGHQAAQHVAGMLPWEEFAAAAGESCCRSWTLLDSFNHSNHCSVSMSPSFGDLHALACTSLCLHVKYGMGCCNI